MPILFSLTTIKFHSARNNMTKWHFKDFCVTLRDNKHLTMEKKHKVILTGTTGYVGEGVLLAMLADARIEKVLSVSRRSCGHSHPKLEELIVPDLMELKGTDQRLAGYDICFFAAGITSVGTPADVYRMISNTIPVHFAEILPNKEKMTFIYVSGYGTSAKGKQQWQKVKSSTEQAVNNMGFKHAFGWRPMLMAPFQGQINKQLKAQKGALLFYPLGRLLGFYCTMKEMCNAIISVHESGYKRFEISPADIIRLGR